MSTMICELRSVRTTRAHGTGRTHGSFHCQARTCRLFALAGRTAWTEKKLVMQCFFSVRVMHTGSANRSPVRPGRTDEQWTNQNSTCICCDGPADLSGLCAWVSSWTPVRTGRMHGCQKSRLNARPRHTGRASGPCARVVRTDLYSLWTDNHSKVGCLNLCSF